MPGTNGFFDCGSQGRVAQLDLAPTLAGFASRSVISRPPRFVRDHSARATLAAFVETHRLRTSDAERAQGVSRKPSCNAIRESRIASSPLDKMIDSILPALGLRPTLRIVYVKPLPRAPLTRLHPAFSPFGLPVHLIASRAFETRSRPPLSRRYPRGFAFYVAFPKSSIRSLSLPICVAQFP
jgi:hypothetical protein